MYCSCSYGAKQAWLNFHPGPGMRNSSQISGIRHDCEEACCSHRKVFVITPNLSCSSAAVDVAHTLTPLRAGAARALHTEVE